METIEKLFVQIFDRKRSIIDNLKQQQQLYYQHLTSKLLIHGISPPPFLLTPDFSDEFSVLNKEELISGLLLSQPGPLVSYPSCLSFFHDKPVGKAVESGLPNELHATCASSNVDDEVDEIAQHPVDGPEKDPGIVPPCHVDGPEKDSGIVPPCHVDGFGNKPSYIPMSPEDQTDTVFSSTYSKAEKSLARIQRSRSRQKALEHRNSAKASAKSRLGKERDSQSPGKETRMKGQQLDDLRESVELAEPLDFSSETYTKEAAVTSVCARDTRGSDTGCNSRSQTTGHEIRGVQMGDNEMIEKSSDYRGLAESRSSCSLSNVGDYLGNDKMTGCRNRQAQQLDTDDLRNGRVTESSSDRNTEAYHGRVTRSRSETEEVICGHQNHSKSQEVFIGRMTRSRSGNAQQPKIDVPQNEAVVRSHNCRELTVSGLLPNRNSKACSGRITKSRSMDNQVEAGYRRSWATNDLSVQPKQLDFDEAEENCMADIQTKCQGISVAKKTSPNVQENFASLPCSLSTVRTAKSLSCEKLEGCSRENAQLSLISDTILGNNLVFTDCPTGSQITDEHELGCALEFDIDATLSRLNEYSHQKHTIEPEGGQTLSKEAARFSLMDISIDAMINLHRETSGTSVSLLNIQHELSSDDVHNKSSHHRTIECVQSSFDKASARSLNSTPDFCPASTSNEPRYECAPNMKVDCQSTTGGLQTSGISSYVGSTGSKLQKLEAGLNVLPDYNYENAIDCSYPFYKRRKTEYQLNSKSAGPSVRLNPVSAVDKSIQRKSSEDNQGARTSLSDGPQLTPNMQHDEGNVCLGGSAMNLFTSDNTQPSISCVSKVKTAEPSDSFSGNRKAPVEPISALHYYGKECDDLDPVKDVADGYFEEKIDFTEIAVDQRDSLQGVGKLKFSVGSPLIERMDVYLSDGGDVPEYESFVVSEERQCVQNDGDGIIQDANSYLSTITNDSSLLGQMCRSASLCTPSSPFPTGYKFHQMPGMYHSVSNGLLENIDLGSNELISRGALRGKSYSDYSFPSIPGWDTGKPYISPLGKGSDGTATKSGDSGKQVSGNVELVCFPIKEDPESSDEEVNGNDVAGTSTHEVDSATRNCSNIEPLRDITSNNESTLDPSQAVQKSNAESVRSEICVNEIPNKDSKKSEFRQSNRLRKPGRENQSLSIGANSLRKHSESICTRTSKPKLSGKSSLQSRGQSFSEKEPKRYNIVSNVKSFLPIVQQKQAAAALPAKREVKVKALEAAEAAKHLAEKRENERKQKKEAMKLERSRLEQENLKQMELKKILKEKEKKKRDAENAEKKRQREEEEKKEKERKRRRIGGARAQQQRAEEKLHAWREESRCEAEDGKAYEKKDSNARKENQDDGAKEQDVSKKPSNELLRNGKIDAAQLIINDNKASTGSSDTVQVGSIDVPEISTPNVEKNFQFANQTSREQSYDISPYQCSDDEEDEENDVPSKKLIPTWASKSNVAIGLSSLEHLDPDSIFLPGSFCSLEEVLLPRRLNTKMTGRSFQDS